MGVRRSAPFRPLLTKERQMSENQQSNAEKDAPRTSSRRGMPDPASLTPEESARWAEALDGRPRVLPPEEGNDQ